MAANWLPPVFQFPADRAELDRRLHRLGEPDRDVEARVAAIIREVRTRGADALVEFAERFDRVRLSKKAIAIPPARLKAAWDALPGRLQRALRLAKRRIEAFHRRQKRSGWAFRDAEGVELQQRVWPLESVGCYIPGGAAPLFSTVLMTTLPAKVAGVKRIVVVTPPLGVRRRNESILAAAHLCGVREVYQSGGAQAVAALAYGADPVPRVDKVVGPGDVWAQEAKRQLYGVIDIDMVAGPTEVLVLADRSAPPAFVAADLLAQSEHAPNTSAWAILIGDCDVDALLREIERQTEAAPRREIIQASLKKNGALVRVRTRAEAVRLANQRAPEHISILTKNAEGLAKGIRNAGAVFLGPWTPESVGDYVAGPNHVLPTGRTARFFSALGVDSFVRTDHVIRLRKESLQRLGEATIAIGEAEGLYGHAQAVRERLK